MLKINTGLQMKMMDNHSVVVHYWGEEPTVVIPDTYAGLPVTEIAAGAFTGNRKVESVILPDTITSIGENAFMGCNFLRFCGQKYNTVLPPAVTLFPKSLRYIGKRGFQRTSIEAFVYDGEALELDDYAFALCRGLSKIALRGCKELSLGDRVFTVTELSYVDAPLLDLSQYHEDCFGLCPMGKKTGVSSLTQAANRSDPTMGDWLRSLEDIFAPVKPFENAETRNTAIPVNGEGERTVPSLPCGPALFFLQTPDEEAHLSGAASFTGYMKRFTFKMLFIADSAKDAPVSYFTFDCEHNPEKAIWLEEYLSKQDMKVTLSGQWNVRTFCVSSIKVVKDTIAAADLREDFFELFLKGTLNDRTGGKPMTDKETEAFFELNKTMMPQWVYRAYKKNSAIASSSYASGNSSEDRKHATRALRLLAAINWMPHEISVPSAREVRARLDSEFFGLVAVKDRISEIVSQIKRSKHYPKWGLLLHGPAGVGKTTIAKATADALSLPLIQIDVPSLGKDADTLVGSSRVYGNARPGLLLNSMFDVRSSSAVLLVNELDKLANQDANCVDALLSILDKTGLYEQFLEETIPTDNLFCIATCNDLDKISGPMKDRFQIIEIGGYTMSEKSLIWDQYVFPAAIRRTGVAPDRIYLTEDAVDTLVHEYAFTPGARDLEQYAERIIGNYCLAAEENENLKIQYFADDIRKILGDSHRNRRYICNLPGVVNAAFYHDGAAYFFAVEASVRKGSGKFEVLGALPKIQEEYAKIAYLCAFANTNMDMSKIDVSIFVPQMLPDGPKNHIGLATYIAICCKILNIQLPLNDIVFLGGCDLNGSVYCDEMTLDPMLRSMNERGVKTLYAPVGCAFDLRSQPDYNLEVIEAPDAQSLLALALARSKQ